MSVHIFFTVGCKNAKTQYNILIVRNYVFLFSHQNNIE